MQKDIVVATERETRQNLNADEGNAIALHHNGVSWEDCTVDVNEGANTVTCEVSSLSPFITGISEDDVTFLRAIQDYNNNSNSKAACRFFSCDRFPVMHYVISLFAELVAN